MKDIAAVRHAIPLSSACLQTFWILAIWWTGATANVDKLQILLVCALALCLLAYLVPAEGLQYVRRRVVAVGSGTGRGEVLFLSGFIIAVGGVYSTFQGVETLVAERSVYDASVIVAREGLGALLAQYGKLHWLGIQHPPFVPWLNGTVMGLFGENLLVVRLVSLAFGLGTVLALYGFGRDLYGHEVGLTAAVCFICFPYFFRLSAAASNDIQVTFFFLLTLWITFRLRCNPSWSLAAVGGLALGLGILSKYPMVLIYPVLSYVFWTSDREAARARQAFLASVSVAVVLAWLGLAFHIGILQLQSDTLTDFSLSVAETIWGKWMFLEFATTRLPSALGVYSLPTLLVGGVFVATRPWDPNDRLLLVWSTVVFGFFSITLPDSRYCLPAYPALALIMARGLDQIPQAKEKVLWLLVVECALALYLFVDWSRSSHLFIDEYKDLMP